MLTPKNIIIFAGLMLMQSLTYGHVIRLVKKEKARKSDQRVEYYLLYENGELHTFKNGERQKIHDHVVELKIPHHSQTPHMAYFIREPEPGIHIGNLWYVDADGNPNKLPDALNIRKVKGQYKFDTVTNIKSQNRSTNMDLIYLNEDHQFFALSGGDVVLKRDGVTDYQLNENYGQYGKPFSSYLAFLHVWKGSVLKLKGDEPIKVVEDDSRQYDNLRMFIMQHKLSL